MVSEPQNGPSSKRCSRCGEVKPLEAFSRDRHRRDGRQVYCKACSGARYRQRLAAGVCVKCSAPAVEGQVLCAKHRAAQAARDAARVASGKAAEQKRAHRERLRSRTPEQIEADRRRLYPGGVKRCRSCGLMLELGEFYEDASSADGLLPSCRPCHNARVNGRLLRRALPRWEELDTWRCVYCDQPYEDLDHVIAKALGGTDDPINLVPACSTCNRGPGGKFDTPVLEWAVERWPELGPVLDRMQWRVEVVDG